MFGLTLMISWMLQFFPFSFNEEKHDIVTQDTVSGIDVLNLEAFMFPLGILSHSVFDA